jgi:hypothetical protein
LADPKLPGGGGKATTIGTTATDIGGSSILKGLVLYGAVISAAAALAGVLGSAFALDIGSPTDPGSTNPELAKALVVARTDKKNGGWTTYVRRALSLEPADVNSASWPKTFGIWVYALIAGAVAITYIVNSSTTPGTVRALAISFGGYVIALITRAYGITTKGG